jgi:hypothetical protein
MKKRGVSFSNDKLKRIFKIFYYSSSTKKIANQVNINQGDKKAIAPSAPSSAKNAAPLSPTSRLERTDSKKINIYDSFKAQKKLIDKNHIGTF